MLCGILGPPGRKMFHLGFTVESLKMKHTPKPAYRDTSSKDTSESLPTPSALPPTRLAHGPAYLARPFALEAPVAQRTALDLGW